MRKNNYRSIPTTEVKSRVKMWRSGKNWVYGLLFFFGMAGISFGQANLVHADTTALSAETEKGTLASQLTDRAVPLQTSISKSADDSTTTATSDSEPDISGTNAEQTDATVDPSTTEATGSDTTDTTAPATDSEPTTAGDQTESATTESPVSDPVNLSTTDSTDTTGATDQADSSTATKSDATPVAQQTDSDTASSTSNETAETTNTDEIADTVTPTTETAEQTDSSATLETSTTTETPVSEESTAPVTEAASTSVDTSNTPLPEVSYKSLLSSSQVNALSQTQTLSSTNSAAGVAADIPAFTSSNGVLPEGFTVTDPDYPAGAFANDEASGLYSFFEGTRSGVKVVLSTDRATATHIYVQKVSGGTASEPVELAENQKYKGVSGFTIIDSGPDIDSVYVLPDTGATMAINYEIYSYRTGSNGTWSGFAVLKPLLQTQTTRYLDQAGNEIADSVEMKGLSGQNYTTGTPASLSGYTTPDTSNASGFMSPFSYDGQQFNEQLYKNGAEWGVLTYTVKDVKAGTMEVSFSGGGLEPTTLTYVPKGETIKKGEVTYTAIGNYNIPNIYIPQTDHVDYNYQADSANVDVSFVDENGNSLTPDDPTNSTLTMLFNEATTISPAAIKGYTYNAGYQPTAEDDQTATHNPETYTVTDIDNPGKIILHYTANPEMVTVKHVDANNNSIGTITEITGKYNDTLTVDEDTDANWTIEGYQATGPVSHTFNNEEGQTVTVQYDQTAKVSLNYVVDHADGTTTNLDAAQLGLQTQLTGVVGTSVFIDSPEIPGYTAVSTTSLNHTLVAGGDDVTLHYTANEVGVEVDFVDSQTGESIGTPMTTTTTLGNPVQLHLAGSDVIMFDNYTFGKTPVTGGSLDQLPDKSIVLNVAAPTVATNLLKVTVPLDLLAVGDAPDDPKTADPTLYKMTHRTMTITTDTAGDGVTPSSTTQTVIYERTYTYDSYSDSPSPIGTGWGQWTLSGDSLKTFASGGPEGYTKTITLASNGGTAVTMTDDDAVNAKLQADLQTLIDGAHSTETQNTATEVINVTYTVTEHQLTVHFINNADNSEIETQTFEGPTNGPIDFSTLKDTNGQTLNKAQAGYVLVDDQTTDLSTFAATDPQDANLYYTPITGKFSVAVPNASTPTEILYANDPADPHLISAGTTPVISGYTAYIDGPDGPIDLATTDDGNYIIPAPDDPTSTTTVKFRENDVNLTVRFVDVTDATKELKADQIFSGADGSKVDYTHDINGHALDRYVKDYLLVFDSTTSISNYDSSDKTQREPTIGYRPVDNFTYQTPDDQPTTTSYQTDPNNPSAEFGTVPYVEGFTPTSTTIETFTPVQGPDGEITSYTFRPSDPTTLGTIQYRADSQKMLVHFKNTDNESIATDVTVTGGSETTINYDKVAKFIDGYVYDAGASALTNPLDSDDGVTQEATLIYNAVGKYTITTPEGKTTDPTPYTTDPDNPSVATGHIPYTPGYTPRINDKDIPLIDPAYPSKGYDFTPEIPTESTTITYAANDQKLTVHFKSTDNETIEDDVTVTGESASTIDYDTIAKSIDGYVYDADASELTNPLDTVDDTDQEATLIYKASGDYTYTTPGTDTPTTTTYTTDPDDPSAVTGHVPYTPGFTPQINGKDIPLIDKGNPNKGYDFTPADPTQPTTITYAANDQKLTVHFKNTDDETIADDVTVTGESASTIDYDTIAKSIDGYVYDAEASTLTNPLDTEDDTDQEATLIYKASSDYTYTTPGTDTPTTTTYTTDPKDPSAVTGQVPYTPGFTPQINGKDIPLIDKDNPNKGYDFTPGDPTQSTTITYAANDQKLTVHFKSTDNKIIADDVTVTGESASTIDYDTIAKTIDGYVYDAEASTLTNPLDTEDDTDQEATLIYKASGKYTYTTPGTDTPTTTTYTTDPDDPSVATGQVPYTPGFTPQINGKDIPLIDAADPSKGYNFTPGDPTQSTEITYTGNDQTLTVHFETADGVEISGTATLTGASGSAVDYSTLNKQLTGYVLQDDGTQITTKYDTDDTQDQSVILTYALLGDGVTITTPTGEKTTTPYTNDSTEPKDPKTVDPITIPYVPGYTPTSNNGTPTQIDPADPSKGYTLIPAEPTKSTDVTYDADSQTLFVAFVDEADPETSLKPTQKLSGVTDGYIDYTTVEKVIDGYVLDTDETVGKIKFTASDHGQTLTLTYKQIGNGVTLTTPDPDDPDGQQITKTYTNDPTDPSTVLPIDVPYIPGYTPTTPETVGKVEPKDPADPTKGYTFTPKDPAQPAKVTYDADAKSVNVVFVDQADLETLLKPTQNLSGVTDGDIDYTAVEKVIDGYVLLTDETAGKTKFTATDNGEYLTLTYQKTAGGYVGKTPAGVDLTTPYVTDPEDPKAVQPITIPTVPGYTLDIENGKRTPVDDHDPSKGYTVTPIDPSKPTTVSYTPETGKSVQVAYVDENSVEIAGHPVKTISGQTDQTIDYGTKAIAGYVLTADGTLDKTIFAADDDGTLLTISYEKVVVTITKPTDDGNTETVPVDTTTPGHVDYIPGYTPKTSDGKELTPVDGDKTKGYTVPVPDDPTTKTTINYDPDAQTAQVILVDTAGNPVTNDEGQSTYTFHGVTGQGIHEWEVDKKAAAYTISDDGTLHEFVYDNVDGNVQVVKIIYLKTTAFNDPDGGTTTLLTDGSGKVVSIDKKWGTAGGDTNVLIENGVVTLTPNPDGTPHVLKTDVPDGDGTVTGTLGNDGNIILTQKTPDGTVTETITPDGQLSFSQVPAAVSPTPEVYYDTQTTHDPDGGTTTTKTNGNGDITAIDRNWPDGDHSHVDIAIDTGIATITETPAGGNPSEPLTIQPGESGKNGKTTLDNGEPDGNIVLTHPGTDGGKTTETITPDTSRSFSRQPGGVSTDASHYFETQITHDPDGGTTTTKTNGDNDITTIDKDWGDGDHSHVDIDTDTGVATFTETPAGGSPSEPITVQPGESGKNGKTTLDNGEPDGNIVLTHPGTDGGKTTETITPDTSRSFSRQPGGVSTDASHYYTTQVTHDPDGGTTTTKTNGDGDITTIDKDWGDGDHSHVDIDTGTGIAKITETPAGGSPSEPITVQPGESGKNGKTTLDNGEPDGNIVLTHQDTDGDKTTETITPDTSRSFSRQPGGASTDASHYFETQITHDPDGGTTATKTNGDGDITTIDKDWSDGDHSHVDIDTDTGIATITETPNGGEAGTPVEVQPGESGKNGKTTLDNGEPDGNIVLTHQGTDGDKTTETITPDTSRSFSRQPAGVQTTKKDYFETQITHDPDGGTTTTKTNGDGDITTIDKDWSDGDHSHVDIDTDTGIATITETPNGGEADTPVEVQPGESGKNGKTTLDNGEPDGNIVLTHQGTDGDKTTETITPDTSRSFSRQPGGVSTDASHYFETQITHDPDGGTTTTKTNGDGDITTIDKNWSDGDHSHVDIDTDTGIATITETPNGGEAGIPVEIQPGESGKNGKTTLDNGAPDGNIVLTHQGTDGGKTTETITPDTSRSFSRQPGGVQTTKKDYFETQITHDPDGGTTTTKTNGDGDITTIDKDWSDGDHSHVDIDTDTGIATITETPNGGEAGTPVEVQPGESGKSGKTTLDNSEPDGNIVLTHQGTDGGKTIETITPDTSRSFSRQPGGVSTDASHYYTTQVTHDPDGGTTTTKTNGDGDITTIDKDWGDGDHSHVDIDTDTGIATITETPNGGEAGAPIEVQPGESGKNGKTTLDNGEPDGNIGLTHQGTDGDKTTETIAPDTSRSFGRQPGGVSTDASHYYTTQVTHDPDGGTTTTKTNGDGDITTIDKDWGDGDHSHVDINTETGIATITETPNGGEAGTSVEVQPGESGKNGKTTLDNGEPDGNIGLTHQGTDGDKTTETITPDTSRSFSRMPAPVFVTADDFYDTRITHDSDGGTTTTVTNGNGDVTTIDKDWGDGSHTHVTVDPNTGDATATDTDENGNTSTPVTVKPGETGTTGQTTITNGQPDGDIILSHEGTDGDQVEAAISDDGLVRVSLPDTDAEAKAETNVTVTSTPGSTTSANHANLSQTSATSRTDVQGKKSTATQLPETGDKQNGLGLIGATLLAGLAMLGFGKRRRDDED